ncbi:MAG: oxygen-independent coproporphyrinogen III oxidase [Snowella sp.]|nr:oxygen-independent coproporphyrinogen III oxidase [Snowella sp.]
MQNVLADLQFDADLLQKYNQALPRYTSYPPATELTDDFSPTDGQAAIAVSNQRQTPLSLYFHLPFCQSACYFCGCNVIVSNSQKAAENYLEYLIREIEQKAALIDTSRPVAQLHWGGGTPNYLNLDQVERLWQAINRHFTFAPEAEISIEINPRYVDRNYVFSLRALGFNRILPEERLFEVMAWIKEARFESVNVDLIYGLPHQTLQTFRDTIQKTILLDPNRIAVFNFAYIPWIKAVQKNIAENALPSPAEKLDILKMTIEELTRSRYVFIGMDHFAKPDDELAIAQKNNELKRNFQGYTTQPDAELVGFGLTSISMFKDIYIQNHKRLKDYYAAIDAQEMPIEKVIKVNQDDQIRREIIMELMCHFHLAFDLIEEKYGINFNDYFALELADLQSLAEDDLVKISKTEIKVTPRGRLLIRNIVSKFDIYLRKEQIKRMSNAI